MVMLMLRRRFDDNSTTKNSILNGLISGDQKMKSLPLNIKKVESQVFFVIFIIFFLNHLCKPIITIITQYFI